jgi:hypothetical protein
LQHMPVGNRRPPARARPRWRPKLRTGHLRGKIRARYSTWLQRQGTSHGAGQPECRSIRADVLPTHHRSTTGIHFVAGSGGRHHDTSAGSRRVRVHFRNPCSGTHGRGWPVPAARYRSWHAHTADP